MTDQPTDAAPEAVRLSQTTYVTDDIVGLSTFYAELFDLEEAVDYRSDIFRGLLLGTTMLGFSAPAAYELLGLTDRANPTGTGQYLTFDMPDDAAVDARVERAVALGATVIQGPFETYYNAWQCVLADPADNVFRINHFR